MIYERCMRFDKLCEVLANIWRTEDEIAKQAPLVNVVCEIDSIVKTAERMYTKTPALDLRQRVESFPGRELVNQSTREHV